MSRYYLDTNTLYALSNCMDKFTNKDCVNISLLNIQELISKIKDERDFIKRRKIIKKIGENNLNICPYIPIECVAQAFKLDISEIPWVKDLKVSIFKQAKIMSSSETLDEYSDRLQEEGINLFEYLESNKKIKTEIFIDLNKELDISKKEYNSMKKEQKEEIKYIKLDLEEVFGLKESKAKYEKEKMLLIKTLNSCNISYTDEDIENTLSLYNGELTAYLLGIELYNFEKCSTGKCVGKNDLLDITHLLYLRNENDIIVSSDKIFKVSTMLTQRISIEEFKKHEIKL
ncbi:hypothetical protein CDFC105_71248 [Clostridioides difficile]|nr:hypothetical protein CDFC105_64307 [Clostridioides difficile]CZS03609.1 hypothetical protein CDFC105_71248 [Clostridioides difficile]